MATESQNEFEYEDLTENSEDYNVTQKDFSGLHIIPSDWTVGTIRDQIKKELDIDPDFQRRGVWTKVAKSRFIESLFLGIPIPQILLADDTSGEFMYIVLDGKQRLSTIKEFFDEKFDDGSIFKLSGLNTLEDLNNKTWTQISKDPEAKRQIERTTIRTAVLKNWRHDRVLYEIFYRLNSGAIKLSPMELRMVLQRGPFLKHVIKWTEKPSELHKLLNISGADKRMKDVELTVRHLAFCNPNISYEGNLKDFLDECCKLYNRSYDWNFTEGELSEFITAISSARKIFGPKSTCRKWLPKEKKFDSRFNRAVFDIQICSLRNSQLRQWASKNRDAFVDGFKSLFEDAEFVRAVETTTKSSPATRIRFNLWYQKINQISGIGLTLPNIKQNASSN